LTTMPSIPTPSDTPPEVPGRRRAPRNPAQPTTIDQMVEQHRATPGAVVKVMRVNDQGIREGLGSEARFAADAFDLDEVADRFGGGGYYVQWTAPGGTFLDGAPYVVAPHIRARRPSPPSAALSAAALPAGVDQVQALREEFKGLAASITDAVKSANRPRTVAEMSAEEFAALLGRSVQAAAPGPRGEVMTIKDTLGMLPQLATVFRMFRPRSGFDEAMEAHERLSRMQGGQAAPEPEVGKGIVTELISLFREDPLIRKAAATAIEQLTRPAAAPGQNGTRKVPNTAQRPQTTPPPPPAAPAGNGQPGRNESGARNDSAGGNAPAAGNAPLAGNAPDQGAPPTSARAAVPASIAPFIPHIAKALGDELDKRPDLSCINAAEEMLNEFGEEAMAIAFLEAAPGVLASALIRADPRLPAYAMWVTMMEGAARALLMQEPDDDGDDEGDEGTGAPGDAAAAAKPDAKGGEA